MNAFSNMLRISGYNAFYHYQTIRGAILRMRQVRENVANGTWTSQYRSKEAIASAKAAQVGPHWPHGS